MIASGRGWAGVQALKPARAMRGRLHGRRFNIRIKSDSGLAWPRDGEGRRSAGPPSSNLAVRRQRYFAWSASVRAFTSRALIGWPNR